jgi:hypothetical protein
MHCLSTRFRPIRSHAAVDARATATARTTITVTRWWMRLGVVD